MEEKTRKRSTKGGDGRKLSHGSQKNERKCSKSEGEKIRKVSRSLGDISDLTVSKSDEESDIKKSRKDVEILPDENDVFNYTSEEDNCLSYMDEDPSRQRI